MTSLIPTLPGVSRQWVTTVRFDTPATTRMLFEPGYAWETEVSEIEPGPDPNDTWPLEVTQAVDSPTRYAAGRTYRDRWNAAALVPAPAIAERAGDDLQLAFSPHLDADGHGWFTVTPDSAAGKLYRDGKLLAESSDFGYVEVGDVPAAPARYRFETSMTRSVSELSTRIDVTTTFTSAGGDREQFPLRAVRYLPDVDARNTVKRAPVTVLPVLVQGLPGQRLPAVQRLEVQVSGDGGASWRPARVVHDGVDKYRAVFPTPAGQTVSLRAHLVDRAGNSTDQTVVGAYKVR
ncbi:hypothetical protein [Kribbella italica]|uniref:Uncharacterized protein n=1 Tax=Kribbella italica TaxID=1540520 RepID=A0A7W9J8Q5_9ACTN|nr:hypothetical protein [Kribbella italica]MBB5837207.1 hypothetical protein [Kribbella italica]